MRNHVGNIHINTIVLMNCVNLLPLWFKKEQESKGKNCKYPTLAPMEAIRNQTGKNMSRLCFCTAICAQFPTLLTMWRQAYL